MGRYKKPNEIKKLQGTYTKARDNEIETNNLKLKTIPNPPSDLPKDAVKYWNQACNWLLSVSLLHECDEQIIKMYAIESLIYDTACKNIINQSLVAKSPSGYPINNPYIGIKNKAIVNINSFLIQLGMTPAARANLGKSGISVEDDFSQFE